MYFVITHELSSDHGLQKEKENSNRIMVKWILLIFPDFNLISVLWNPNND